jgi:hypothetical protein
MDNFKDLDGFDCVEGILSIFSNVLLKLGQAEGPVSKPFKAATKEVRLFIANLKQDLTALLNQFQRHAELKRKLEEALMVCVSILTATGEEVDKFETQMKDLGKKLEEATIEAGKAAKVDSQSDAKIYWGRIIQFLQMAVNQTAIFARDVAKITTMESPVKSPVKEEPFESTPKDYAFYIELKDGLDKILPAYIEYKHEQRYAEWYFRAIDARTFTQNIINAMVKGLDYDKDYDFLSNSLSLAVDELRKVTPQVTEKEKESVDYLKSFFEYYKYNVDKLMKTP